MNFSTCTIAVRVDDPEVGDCVDARRNVVLGDHFLRRDVERDRPQIDLDDPVDDRDQERDARPLRVEQTPEPEDDPALILAEDSDEERGWSFQWRVVGRRTALAAR
jgi:hypothetical protein